MPTDVKEKLFYWTMVFWVLITEFSLFRNAVRAPVWQGRATYAVIALLVSSCWYGFERNRKSNRMAGDSYSRC